jgi:hypothetical protein
LSFLDVILKRAVAGLAPKQWSGGNLVVDKVDLSRDLAVTTPESQSDSTDADKPAKKKFVTPEISVPVDVLEATTFFQLTDSGNTQP